MLRQSRFRILIALSFALSGLAVVAAPAMAETVIKGCTSGPSSSLMGVCGYWEVYDASVGKKGAVCVYAKSYPYQLDKITVRPPLMHGYYQTNTKVGWRFSVQRMSVNSGPWVTTYTSSYQTANANDAIPAYVGHGFSRRAYTAPNNPAGYYYRIVLDLQWWKNGSVEGYYKIKYDWYKRIRGGTTDTQPNWCLASY